MNEIDDEVRGEARPEFWNIFELTYVHINQIRVQAMRA